MDDAVLGFLSAVTAALITVGGPRLTRYFTERKRIRAAAVADEYGTVRIDVVNRMDTDAKISAADLVYDRSKMLRVFRTLTGFAPNRRFGYAPWDQEFELPSIVLAHDKGPPLFGAFNQTHHPNVKLKNLMLRLEVQEWVIIRRLKVTKDPIAKPHDRPIPQTQARAER